MLCSTHATRLASLLAPLLGTALIVACGSNDPSSVATAPSAVEAAEAEAEPSPAPPVAGDAAMHMQRSLELEQQGDLAGSEVEAKAAIDAGGGRDAILQQAKLAILGQRYDEAATPLGTLALADPNDAAVQYDLALVRHHQGDYNRARNGYLATLRADPQYADARYNLAVLCLAHGFAEEARHHAAKFRASFPQDPRGPELELRVGGAGAAGPAEVVPAAPGAPTPSDSPQPDAPTKPTKPTKP